MPESPGTAGAAASLSDRELSHGGAGRLGPGPPGRVEHQVHAAHAGGSHVPPQVRCTVVLRCVVLCCVLCCSLGEGYCLSHQGFCRVFYCVPWKVECERGKKNRLV